MIVSTENRQLAITKMNSFIEKGRANASRVIEHVFNHQPVDRLPLGNDMHFQSVNGQMRMNLAVADGRISAITENFHRHAIGQVSQVTDVPTRFIDSLMSSGAWGSDLLAHNLNTIFHNAYTKQRFLTRSVNGEVRGLLSDRYRRIDSRPITEAFTLAMKNIGALAYEGHVTDTKVAIQAVLPEIYEPVPGEFVVYGVSWSNSDFGNGANEVSDFLIRLLCLNGATGTDVLRQIHLGRRLDPAMIYSRETYELDSKTAVSATTDVINKLFDKTVIDARMDSIRSAADQKLSIADLKSTLKKLELGKGETQAVTEAFNSPDIEQVPAGMNAWRLSNALSWVAGQTENVERKLELQKAAGSILNPKAA